ncbi:MAG: S41 family peptidase [Flavobacteriales bacterium]
MKNLFYVLFCCFPLMGYSQFDPSERSTSQKFDEVLGNILRFYVDPVNGKELTEEAIVAMLEKLDPHSTYIPAEELNEAQSTINGSFVGIGIRFQIMKDTLHVVATIPGGPCEKLGVLPGDQIISVDAVPIAGVGLKNQDVRTKLMGELGSKVKITVRRKGKILDYTVTRDKIPVYSVDAHYMIDKETGYIKLNSFSRTTTEEVQKAMMELKAKGMKNLIFDLQGNGGGLLDAAHKLADEFLSGDKLVVYSEGRAQPRSNLRAGKKGLFETGKLILLTDEYSASASEILSGSIQDWDRGLIVGRRTYGKGLVQRPMPLSDGSEIRLTIARYYTPTGRFIQKPYDDTETYRKDITQRFLNGEFIHADSIKMPDSLKFETLKTHRTVYGGGGIMPDYFVPLDTTENSKYFGELVQGGLINSFSFNYVNEKRNELKSLYPTFEEFKTKFNCDQAFMDAFFAFVQKEDSSLTFNEKDYKTSEHLIKLRLKSNIASDLWGTDEMFQIYNDSNEILQRAIQIIQSKEYDKVKLD